MRTSPVTAGRGGMGLSRLLGTAALAAGLAGPALAAEPIPLQAGLYCGPDAARIVVDVAHDRVEIDGMVCSFPVIAADHLQSDLCAKPDGTTGRESYDFSVVGRDFFHAGAWYRLCAPVPADAPTATKAGG